MICKHTAIASAIAMVLSGASFSVHAQEAEDAATTLDSVEVRGIRSSLEKSIAGKRDSDSLVEVITAEDVGKMPDKNVADSLQRVPGVTTQSQSGGSGGFDENDRVSGLESGVDDYVVKPFSARELLARIKAVIRRTHGDDGEGTIQVGPLQLDSAAHRVRSGDIELHLGPIEYRLLAFFMTHTDRVYSRAQLLDQVWGSNVYVEERTVDVHIRRLRKALEKGHADALVQTVRGAGYRCSAVA